MPQQIFADAVPVELFFRIDAHHVIDKGQVPEGNPRFERICADAPVRPEHIIHMDLTDPLARFLLESSGIRGKVGIFVSEQLVRDLTGQEDFDIRVLADPAADQVHAHGSPDGGDVVSSQRMDDFLQGAQDILRRDDHLMVIAVDVISHFPCVFKIDRILFHADREGLDGLFHGLGGDPADQGRVEPAREKEADRRICVQAREHAFDQKVTDICADRFRIVRYIGSQRRSRILVADKLPVFIIMARRERPDSLADPGQVLRLRCEENISVPVISVIEGTDADGIAGGDEAAG